MQSINMENMQSVFEQYGDCVEKKNMICFFYTAVKAKQFVRSRI